MSTEYLELSYDECIKKVKEIVHAMPSSEDKSKYWVVFDIDHTLLTDSKYKKYYKSSNDVFKYMHKGDFGPIVPMVNLYNWCADQGLSMCIITGRKEGMRQVTQANLTKVGIKKCHRFYMRKIARQDTVEYKSTCRKEIMDRGDSILLNIGDQKDDLLIPYGSIPHMTSTGDMDVFVVANVPGYARYAIKLPSQY